nr:RNA-dependent RNA polymerase [Riboviria sp.]
MEQHHYITNHVSPYHSKAVHYHPPIFCPEPIYTYHAKSYHNEKAALHLRHCEPCFTLGEQTVGQTRRTSSYHGLSKHFINTTINLFRPFRPKVPLQPFTRAEYINTMPPKYQHYLHRDTSNFSHVTKSFIKKEKIAINRNKPPRMITANSMPFNIEIGRYTKRFEHHLYGIDKKRQSDMFAKGYDMKGMAAMIIRASHKFHNPKYICLDHTCFDSFITPEHKRLVARLILQAYRNDPFLQSHLMRTNVFGYTQHGHRYRINGTLNSGSPITSLTANIINYAVIHYIFKFILRCKKFHVIVNGDDSIVITERAFHINRHQIINSFARFNFKTKIDQITTNVHEVEFCRCRIAYDNMFQPMCYITPERIVETFGQTFKCIDRISYLRDISYAYSIIYKNLENYHNTFHLLYKQLDKMTKKPLFKAIKLEPLIKILHDKMKDEPRIPQTYPHYTQPRLPPQVRTSYLRIKNILKKEKKKYKNKKIQKYLSFSKVS